MRRLAENLDARGAPAWAPDGQWIAIAAKPRRTTSVFKIPAGGGEPVLLTKEYALDPAWSPTGSFLLYSGADVGAAFPVKAVTADGQRQLTAFGRGSTIADFDVSADGREVVFDRAREESDIVLIDLAGRL